MSKQEVLSNLELLKISLNEPKKKNDHCFDCLRTNGIEWASVSYGIVLCIDCALLHKSELSPNISRIKSLTMPYWSYEEAMLMAIGGNNNFENLLKSYEIEDKNLSKYNHICVDYYKQFLFNEAYNHNLILKKPKLEEGKKIGNYISTSVKNESSNFSIFDKEVLDQPSINNESENPLAEKILYDDIIVKSEVLSSHNIGSSNDYQDFNPNITNSTFYKKNENNLNGNENVIINQVEEGCPINVYDENKKKNINSYNSNNDNINEINSSQQVVTNGDIFNEIINDSSIFFQNVYLNVNNEIEKSGIKENIKDKSNKTVNFIEEKGNLLINEIAEKSSSFYNSFISKFIES